MRLSWFLLALSLVSTATGQTGVYDWSGTPTLGPYAGIEVVQRTVAEPRPMSINCLRVDTTTPGLRFYTTPQCRMYAENAMETVRKTTRQFLVESQTTDTALVVAINANRFLPWPAPWNQETVADLEGLAVSEGIQVSPGSGKPSLLVGSDGAVSIATTDKSFDARNVRTAVSGGSLVLSDGVPSTDESSIHPRTALGLSQSRRYVYFLTIDGRQRASTGATLGDVGVWLKHLGAHNGINMDGGGSTTLVWWDPAASGADKSRLLNVPVGNGQNPGSAERCNGNNLGVYYTTVGK